MSENGKFTNTTVDGNGDNLPTSVRNVLATAATATAHHLSLSAPTARNGVRQVMLLAIARGDEREIGNLNFITAAANAMYNAIIVNLQQEHCHF